MIHETWFLIVSLAVLAIGTAYDVRTSLLFPWYGTREGVKLWQDKYGFFDIKKNLLWFGGFIALLCVMGFVWFGKQIALAFLIIGVGRLLAGIYNWRGMKKNRVKQTELLTKVWVLVTQGVIDENDPAIINLLRKQFVWTKADRAFYHLFGWLWVENDPDVQGVVGQRLRLRLLTHATKPASEWFPR